MENRKIGRIDLHTHSTASDGTMTPEQLVKHAAELGLKAIALTDHDTVEGVVEAMEAGERFGVIVVPGVEISLDYKGPKVDGRSGWMHLLVYNINLGGKLAAELSHLQKWRKNRNHRIIEKLRNLGLDISLDEVAAVAGGGQLGRPHFARVMLQKGYVEKLQDAFDKYLAKGAPAYEDKRRLSIKEALDLAIADGAVPVLAHPFSLGLSTQELHAKLKEWKALGLVGLEVEYPEHDDDYRESLTKMAEELDLIITGGSDFHGDNKPDVRLGSGINGNIEIDEKILGELVMKSGD